MIESNNNSASPLKSESDFSEYKDLPLLYNSIADSLLIKTRHLAQLKATQIEELNKLSCLERATIKRKLDLEKKTITYEEYEAKIQSNQLTKHDIKAIVNIYISILTSQDNELEKKRRRLKEKENELRIQESILSLLTMNKKTKTLSEVNLNAKQANKNDNKSLSKNHSYDRHSSESIKGRGHSVEKVNLHQEQGIKRQRSVPRPKKNDNSHKQSHNNKTKKRKIQLLIKDNKESNSNSIHQIEDDLLDKLEQNIPVMACIQNDQLITDSVQLQNDNSYNNGNGIDNNNSLRMLTQDKNTKKKKNELLKTLSKDSKGEVERHQTLQPEAHSFKSNSIKSNSNQSSTVKKQLSSSKSLHSNKANQKTQTFKRQHKHQQHLNKNKIIKKEAKAKTNITPISLNLKPKSNDNDSRIKSNGNKTENSEKSNTLLHSNSSVKEMDKFLKYQSMKFIAIMNKMVIHNSKRKKKECIDSILRFSLKIKKKKNTSSKPLILCNIFQQLSIRQLLSTLVKAVLPHYLNIHNKSNENMSITNNKDIKGQKKDNGKCSDKDNNDALSHKRSSGRLFTNEPIKPEVNKVLVTDLLSEENDNEIEHCDFKTYQQSLTKIKEITKETQCLENNMKLFTNQINNKTLPTA